MDGAKCKQVGINAANIQWPLVMNVDPTTYEGKYIFSFVNAAVYFSAALVGCWFSDPLNNFFGRRGCIVFAALFSFGSSFGSAFTQTWEQLLACRILLGDRFPSPLARPKITDSALRYSYGHKS